MVLINKINNIKEEELPILYHVNSMDVYNLLQDIGTSKLIIDLRKKESYDINHIRTAVNIPPPPTPTDEFNITKYISSNVTAKHWNLIFQKVIVYSDKPFLYNIQELENTINGNNKNDQDIVKPLILSNWDKIILRHFLNKRKKTKIIIYQGGFDHFEKHYPFMCCNKITGSSGGGIQLYPSEIIENFLYLGGVENSNSRQQIQNLKITHIVNMASELDDLYSHIYKYYRADLDDRPKANIYTHFEPVIQFINDAKSKNGRVLVHCAMGISRSTTVVIAYLMKEDNMSFQDAFTFVKEKRSIVNPNFGFVKQLKDYEQFLIEQRKKSNGIVVSSDNLLKVNNKHDLVDPLSNSSPASPLISSKLPVVLSPPPIILKNEEPTTTNKDSIFNLADKQEEEKMTHAALDSPISIPQSSL